MDNIIREVYQSDNFKEQIIMIKRKLDDGYVFLGYSFDRDTFVSYMKFVHYSNIVLSDVSDSF